MKIFLFLLTIIIFPINIFGSSSNPLKKQPVENNQRGYRIILNLESRSDLEQAILRYHKKKGLPSHMHCDCCGRTIESIPKLK